MGRPQKRGLDYFSLDTMMDTKIELIEASHGLVGYAVVVKLWQKIYGGEGYFYTFGEDEQLLFTKHNGVSIDMITSILAECFKRGIFSKDKYERYGILTSSGVQKRYFEATQKRACVPVIREYLLVIPPQNAISDAETDINSAETLVSDSDSAQRKEEKSKGEETREDTIARVREGEGDGLRFAQGTVDDLPEEPDDSPAKPTSKAKARVEAWFDEFWAAYPKKVGRGDALKAYKKIKLTEPLHRQMLDAIERARQCEQWQREQGRFIPNPATWLNQERWSDEYPSPPLALGKQAANPYAGNAPPADSSENPFLKILKGGG